MFDLNHLNFGEFLASKELKQVYALLESQWGFDEKLEQAFFLSGKERLYLINRAVDVLDFNKLRINSIGLYFGELRHGELRLSIEGSQIVGPGAKKNVVELNHAERKLWLQGVDVNKNCKETGFIIIKSSEDFVGCGKCKDGRILNFVPKARRLFTADFASE